MKRLLCLLVSILLVLSFAACESDDDDRRSSRKSKKEQTVASSDYEDAIDLLMKVFACDISEKELKSMFPAVCWDYFEEEGQSFEEIYDMVSSDLENSKAYLEEEFGEDFYIKYEIVSKEKVDEDDEDYLDFIEEIEDMYNIESLAYGDCYMLEIEASMVGSNKEDPTEMSYHVIEIDGVWYVAEILLEGF